MAQRKRVELEQAVIRAARTWRALATTAGPGGSALYMWPYEQDLVDAIGALDAIPASEITVRRGASNADGPDTQIEAGHLAGYVLRGVRLAIVDELVAESYRHRPGLTTQDLERRLNKPHTTTSSACNGLLNSGWIMDSGQRKLTPSKRQAIVWTLTPAALAHLGLADRGAPGNPALPAHHPTTNEGET